MNDESMNWIKVTNDFTGDNAERLFMGSVGRLIVVDEAVPEKKIMLDTLVSATIDPCGDITFVMAEMSPTLFELWSREHRIEAMYVAPLFDAGSGRQVGRAVYELKHATVELPYILTAKLGDASLNTVQIVSSLGESEATLHFACLPALKNADEWSPEVDQSSLIVTNVDGEKVITVNRKDEKSGKMRPKLMANMSDVYIGRSSGRYWLVNKYTDKRLTELTPQDVELIESSQALFWKNVDSASDVK